MMTTVGKKHSLSAHPQVQRLNLKDPRQGVTCKTPVPTTNSKNWYESKQQAAESGSAEALVPHQPGSLAFHRHSTG